MAPTITTNTHQLAQNAEISFGQVAAAGAGFDFVDAFIDGSGNIDPNEALAEWRLYQIVGTITSLVAKAPGGGAVPSVLDWGVGGNGIPGPAPFSPAVGAGQTFELRAFFPYSPGVTPPTFTASLVGYNKYDTAGNTATSSQQTIPSNFGEVTFGTVSGYAQFVDCIVAQSFNVPIRFTLYASTNATPGGEINAEVAHVTLQSSNGTPARIFGAPIRVPGALSYSLRARFDSQQISVPPVTPVSVTAGIASHSIAATAAGGVVTLTGNTNGPSNANVDQDFVTSTTDANVDVNGQANPHGAIYEGLNGLTANRTVTLTTASAIGDRIVVKDEDGSLGMFNIVVTPGGGKTIDGAATYTMSVVNPGAFGSTTFERISATAWAVV